MGRMRKVAVGQAMPMSALLTTAPQLRGRSGGIDAIRGLFALWVLLTHLIPWSVAVQGNDAVPNILRTSHDLLQQLFHPSIERHPAVLGFIVLSGYCIHRNGF